MKVIETRNCNSTKLSVSRNELQLLYRRVARIAAFVCARYSKGYSDGELIAHSVSGNLNINDGAALLTAAIKDAGIANVATFLAA